MNKKTQNTTSSGNNNNNNILVNNKSNNYFINSSSQGFNSYNVNFKNNFFLDREYIMKTFEVKFIINN
jgi:hypothetical protein